MRRLGMLRQVQRRQWFIRTSDIDRIRSKSRYAYAKFMV